MHGSDKSPTADVYAGDTTSLGSVEAFDSAIHFFDIEAESEPGTFARIVNIFNIANVAPCRVTLNSNGEKTFRVHIEIKVRPGTAQSIQRKLAQLTDVVNASIADA